MTTRSEEGQSSASMGDSGLESFFDNSPRVSCSDLSEAEEEALDTIRNTLMNDNTSEASSSVEFHWDSIDQVKIIKKHGHVEAEKDEPERYPSIETLVTELQSDIGVAKRSVSDLSSPRSESSVTGKRPQYSNSTTFHQYSNKYLEDPDAEVIALSPRTLMAPYWFVCGVCNKVFQREQNLQLHRRSHNLPWKLKQRSITQNRKKTYVCPEATCIHHRHSWALSDLTGIKKHYCRMHGEKKWKCDKCSKIYAVQSDWKAHSKSCGYRCDCGAIFFRKDSFVTHRVFCDSLMILPSQEQEDSILQSSLQNPPIPESSVQEQAKSLQEERDIQHQDSSSQERGNVGGCFPLETKFPHGKTRKSDIVGVENYLPDRYSSMAEAVVTEMEMDEKSDTGEAERNVCDKSPPKIDPPASEKQAESSSQHPEMASADINEGLQTDCGQDNITTAGKKRVVRQLDEEYGIDANSLLQHSDKKLEDVAFLLGVSRSTLKRICRKHNIFRWPPIRTKKTKSNHKVTIQATEANVDDQRMEGEPAPNLLCLKKDPPSKAKTSQKGKKVMVKVSYEDDIIIKFELSVSATKMELEEKIAMRLDLAVGSFGIKYEDEDKEWIWIACDEDLETCIDSLTSSENSATIRMTVTSRHVNKKHK